MRDWLRKSRYLVIFLSTVLSPVFVYFGISFEQVTTWRSLGDLCFSFLSNPYLVITTVALVIANINIRGDNDNGSV